MLKTLLLVNDTRLLFADGHAHRLSVLDARRDRNHDLLPRPHLASAPAVTAGHLDPGSFAMTPPATAPLNNQEHVPPRSVVSNVDAMES